MKDDCRNDCLEALRFPKRPDNRPGLSRIDYRIGRYADIREALLRYLDKTPNLAPWTHRGADDPGIALLEGAAVLGDILTFYQEVYANEAYLRTAQWRESVAELVRLLGYRLSPGLGGRAAFAFEVKGDLPVTIPAGFPVKVQVEGAPNPVDFETSEETTAYPWLSEFNLYNPLTTPNISATTTEFYIEAPDPSNPASAVALKAGDRLMVGDLDSANGRLDNGEIVIVDSMRELHGIRLFKIRGRLKRTASASQIAAYKIGRSFHHFGYNSPPTFVKAPSSVTTTATTSTSGSTTTTTSTSNAVDEKNTAFSRFVYTSTLSSDPAISYLGNTSTARILSPTLGLKEFPLDGEVQDLASGVTLLIQTGLYKDGTSPAKEFTLIRETVSVASGTLTWGTLTGATSLVTLDESLATSDAEYHCFTDIRHFLMHETLSPLLTLRAAMEPAAPADQNILNFYGTAEQAKALEGRSLVFAKSGSDPITAVVNAVDPASSTDGTHPLLHAITLSRNDLVYADFPDAPPYPVTVYGNVVEATQGRTEAQAPLGNGDDRQSFQTFKLPKAPLTYLISESETPPEVPELQIYVNNRLWKRAGSFFGRRPDEEVYIVREAADDNSWVQFGDGKTGARLPSGVKNVVAQYRTGTGAFGALKKDTKVQAGGRVDRLDQIQMPGVASGGSMPEDGENAREAAPGKIQSLDRLVSLEDFESETLAISGVSKAASAWQLVGNIPQVVLTVLMENGRQAEFEEVRQTIAGYNQGRGPNRFPVTVLPGQLEYVVVAATFGYDPTYREKDVESAIRKALGISSAKPNVVDDPSGLFSLRRRNFGQREYATSIAGTIQRVAGVVWAQVTRFDSLGVIPDPTMVVPPATPVVVQMTMPCESENVLSLYAGHLQLAGVAKTLQEVS